jgi:hypothetical protein
MAEEEKEEKRPEMSEYRKALMADANKAFLRFMQGGVLVEQMMKLDDDKLKDVTVKAEEILDIIDSGQE